MPLDMESGPPEVFGTGASMSGSIGEEFHKGECAALKFMAPKLGVAGPATYSALDKAIDTIRQQLAAERARADAEAAKVGG